jgi:hypothetical protein
VLRRPDRRFAILVALIAGLMNRPCPGTEPGSSSTAGAVRRASGPTPRYGYHDNRKATADAGRGRLWLGGEGLAVFEADGKTLRPLDELPTPGRSKIDAIAADPAHPDGTIAAVEDRGVVFVRVDAR